MTEYLITKQPANHPFLISNTYYFYRNGYTGTLIEPDPTLYKDLKKKRPSDIILNCGITKTESLIKNV